MNNEKIDKIIPTDELDNVLPKYESVKLSGKNLAQQYVSAFNTGMNIYQCVNYLQGNIDWTINAVNDVVKSWNDSVDETLSKSIEITEETTTEQFNTEWANKQPELIEQVNTLTTNQFNNEKSIFNDELNALNARMDTFTKLPEGSTTGDAELKDIRVGANGVTYNNAGDAVRGQYSQLKEDLDILNQGGLNLKEDFIGEQVDKWLEKHPEATTTVQDHSLTIDKFIVGSLGYVTPEMFGAVGDGITDDRESFHKMLCEVPDNTIVLCGTDKTYKIDGIVWVNDRHNVTILNGKFLLKGSENNGTVFQIRENSSFITFRNCTFIGGGQVIHLFACSNITVDNCTFIESKYAIIQQHGFVSNNVFVTNNFANNLINDFVECNCEVNAPSKNWIVTGNIYTKDVLPTESEDERRFFGATVVENIIIADNVVENVAGDACVHLEDAGGNVVISNNVFKNSMGTGYVYILHYGKKTVISNNHFINEIADNNTPFVYLYGGLSSDDLDVIINGNIMTGNGNQDNPISWYSFAPETKMIVNNVIKGIGSMFTKSYNMCKWHFANNVVECVEFINLFGGSANPTRIIKEMDFLNNNIIGNIDIRNDYNGNISHNIRFNGNRVKGNISFQGSRDVYMFDNIVDSGYTITFLPSSYNAERMFQGNNFIVGTGLYEVTS